MNSTIHEAISYTDLVERLNKDLWLMNENGKYMWQKYSITPQRYRYSNPHFSHIEEVFVVAKKENDIIIFDETYNQFGVGDLNADQIIGSWCVLGNLEHCLHQLEERNF